MSRQLYLAAVIRFFLAQPGAPRRASRADWAVAQTLYTRRIDLATFEHAVRLATLRRLNASGRLTPIHSLAYYRHVLDRLRPDDLDAGYVDYVYDRYCDLLAAAAPSDSHDRAVSGRR